MAFNSLKQSRSAMFIPVRSLATSAKSAPSSAGSPRLASSATAAIHNQHHRQQHGGGKLKGLAAKLGPMWAVLSLIGGMVAVAGCIGIHTAKQQLLHSPSVQVSKRRRECIPEVDDPVGVTKSSQKFLNKSFLRKVGHIQEKQPGR